MNWDVIPCGDMLYIISKKIPESFPWDANFWITSESSGGFRCVGIVVVSKPNSVAAGFGFIHFMVSSCCHFNLCNRKEVFGETKTQTLLLILKEEI